MPICSKVPANRTQGCGHVHSVIMRVLISQSTCTQASNYFDNTAAMSTKRCKDFNVAN